MEKNTDIAIIGGGLSSFAAALELESSGKEVVLVRKGPGASSLSSGAWDLADHPLWKPGSNLREYADLEVNLRETLRQNSYHPYHLFTGNLADHLAYLAKRAAEAIPVAMAGDGRKNLALLGEMGAFKPSAFALSSIAGGDFFSFERAKLLIVGIEGLSQFRASFLRQCLEASTAMLDPLPWEFIGHWEVQIPSLPSQAALSPIEVAMAFDREEVFVELGKQLSQYLKNKVYTHLLLPPVLGVEHTPQILEALNQVTGLSVAETLAGLPSVPGWRIGDAIERYFQRQGYSVLPAEVVGFESEGGRVRCLHLHQGAERIRLQANRFILATGKYIGGGIQRQQKFREAVFGLPLFYRDQLVSEQTLVSLTRERAFDPQPFLSVGIRVNELAQPVDRNGAVIYDNLFAAGQVLSGFDAIREGCAAGVDILTGTIAGQQCR